MNSEELEISLRTEFESYLKDVFAGMRQEIAQLQEKLDAELERHKSELDVVFSDVLNRVEATREFDTGFKESVTEHLRLAKDEGARITATAIAQAEEMKLDSAPTAGIKEIHDAISDITAQTSQSQVLKSLVEHAGEFAPRGAFFITKNENLVGWRVFGDENTSTDETLREVFLPLSSESILNEAVSSLETVKASSVSHNDDAELFSRLEFDGTQQMVAIPLVARGRGVAVLYADTGKEGKEINAEGLETLVRVAGLTVEVLASAKGTARKQSVREAFAPPPDYSTPAEQIETEQEAELETEDYSVQERDYSAQESEYSAPVAEFEREAESFDAPSDAESFEKPAIETALFDPEPSIAPSVREDAIADTEAELPEQSYVSDDYQTVDYQTKNFQIEEPSEKDIYETGELTPVTEESAELERVEDEPLTAPEEEISTEYQPSYTETAAETSEETADYSAREYAESFAKETDPAEYAKEFSYQSEEPAEDESKGFSYQPVVETDDSLVETTNNYQYENPQTETFSNYETERAESFTAPTESYAAPVETYTPAAEEPVHSYEPVVSQPVQTTPTKSRLSERNVDLPIEVSEDERRLHNDARRFARLLVSEIKLYNEQKVKEGRDSSDLYDRLREAIDRSREMYDKRVQPPVAAKFDYFHYELLNTLAEGDENKLGAGYPGSSVH